MGVLEWFYIVAKKITFCGNRFVFLVLAEKGSKIIKRIEDQKKRAKIIKRIEDQKKDRRSENGSKIRKRFEDQKR